MTQVPAMKNPHVQLYHFTPDEFREWWEYMDVRLLILIDVLRHLHGAVIEISPNPSALGRRRGEGDTSQHNVDKYGRVLAVDVLPHSIEKLSAAKTFFNKTVQAGLTGIGVYPHWKPSPGFHLDTRIDRSPGDPATWGGVEDTKNGNQIYVSVEKAFSSWMTV